MREHVFPVGLLKWPVGSENAWSAVERICNHKDVVIHIQHPLYLPIPGLHLKLSAVSKYKNTYCYAVQQCHIANRPVDIVSHSALAISAKMQNISGKGAAGNTLLAFEQNNRKGRVEPSSEVGHVHDGQLGLQCPPAASGNLLIPSSTISDWSNEGSGWQVAKSGRIRGMTCILCG